MVVIRLSRGGAKKNPFYTVVATDKRKRRDGGFIERLGFYNPSAKGSEEVLRLKLDRIDYWKSQGAQLSDKVTFLIKQNASQEVAVTSEAA
jgi:small subunit ribosomal protein S16